MVRSHTKSEQKALPPPLSLLGCSTAAHSINLHKALTVSEKREGGQKGGEGRIGGFTQVSEARRCRASKLLPLSHLPPTCALSVPCRIPRMLLHHSTATPSLPFSPTFSLSPPTLTNPRQFPVVLGFMYYFNNFTQPALMYLMLHSVYCWCWLTKVRPMGHLCHH